MKTEKPPCLTCIVKPLCLNRATSFSNMDKCCILYDYLYSYDCDVNNYKLRIPKEDYLEKIELLYPIFPFSQFKMDDEAKERFEHYMKKAKNL